MVLPAASTMVKFRSSSAGIIHTSPSTPGTFMTICPPSGRKLTSCNETPSGSWNTTCSPKRLVATVLRPEPISASDNSSGVPLAGAAML